MSPHPRTLTTVWSFTAAGEWLLRAPGNRSFSLSCRRTTLESVMTTSTNCRSEPSKLLTDAAHRFQCLPEGSLHVSFTTAPHGSGCRTTTLQSCPQTSPRMRRGTKQVYACGWIVQNQGPVSRPAIDVDLAFPPDRFDLTGRPLHPFLWEDAGNRSAQPSSHQLRSKTSVRCLTHLRFSTLGLILPRQITLPGLKRTRMRAQ